MKKNKKKQSLLIIALVAVIGIMSIAFALNATTTLFLGADVTTKEVKWEVSFKSGNNNGLDATAEGFTLVGSSSDGISEWKDMIMATSTGNDWVPGDSKTIEVKVVNNGDFTAYYDEDAVQTSAQVEDASAEGGFRDVSDLFDVNVAVAADGDVLSKNEETTVIYTITYKEPETGLTGNGTYGESSTVRISFMVPFTSEDPNSARG